MGSRPRCNNASQTSSLVLSQNEVNTPHQAAIQPSPQQAPAVAPQPQQAAPAPCTPKASQPDGPCDHAPSVGIAAMRQELHAVAQVTDAVGQAVGQDVRHVSKPNRTFKLQHKFPSGSPATTSRRRLLK